MSRPTPSYPGDEHAIASLVDQTDDEYIGRCICGYATTGPNPDTVEADLQDHIDDWDGGPDAE